MEEEEPPRVEKWKNLVDESTKKRKSYLKREHGFCSKQFGGEYETSVGLDFSMGYMMECFPDPMLSWPIEKQAEFATVEVRANTLHKEEWTFGGTQNYWTLFVTIVIQLIAAEIDADGVGNLAFHALYSTNPSNRRRAWILYHFDRKLSHLLTMSRLVKGLLISAGIWCLVTFGIARPTELWYWIVMALVFMIFMFFLWHINILLGKRKSCIHRVKWKELKMEDFTEEQKKKLDKKRLDVWDARILLARNNKKDKET
jgi:hypothetical protein